ncbi:unnamed protein product [Owenia fusiformis]|uniref:Uncharacterized protein n=1 Tax=Owenia fusiformis TaxID=6347 RepID=A0A8J1YA67_OWEFU|nr:unnamed protein product [Owenia fusiformis]
MPGQDSDKPTPKKMRGQLMKTSSAAPVFSAIFGESVMHTKETEFLEAAEKGDIQTIMKIVNADVNFNLNVLDIFGRSALEIAVEGEYIDIVEFLLPKSSIQCINDAMLLAISKDNARLTEMLLKQDLMLCQRMKHFDLESIQGVRHRNSPRFSQDITPLVLASQRNNFCLVKLLLMHGVSIKKPCPYFCDCQGCTSEREIDSVMHSRSRLNRYMGLASPAYLCFSRSKDPILSAFQLAHDLKDLAGIEKEYKKEYFYLSDQCEKYAIDLLDMCRTKDEVMTILNENGTGDASQNKIKLERVRLAIKYEQKRFIANPICQNQMETLWYEPVAWIQHRNTFLKILSLFLFALSLPFLLAIYFIAPKSKVADFVRSPLIKFMSSSSCYLTFLFLIIALATRDEGHLWSADLCCDKVTKALFVCIIVWVIESMMLRSRHNFPLPQPHHLADMFFALANVLSFTRLAHLLPASQQLGPLMISFGQMMKDVTRFLFVFFLVFMAFVCGLTSLYQIYVCDENTHFNELQRSIGSLFWATFGMGDKTSPEVAMENVNLLDKDFRKWTETVGSVLFASYILAGVVVLLNMLIAMMNNSFQEIYEDKDVEWKFARAKLRIQYFEHGMTVPAPLNLIPNPKYLCYLFQWVKKKAFGDSTTEIDKMASAYMKKEVMQRLVRRYIYKNQFKCLDETYEDEDVKDNLDRVFDRIGNMQMELAGLHRKLKEKSIRYAKGSVKKTKSTPCQKSSYMPCKCSPPSPDEYM